MNKEYWDKLLDILYLIPSHINCIIDNTIYANVGDISIECDGHCLSLDTNHGIKFDYTFVDNEEATAYKNRIEAIKDRFKQFLQEELISFIDETVLPNVEG